MDKCLQIKTQTTHSLQPIMKLISFKLKLTEYLAGITVLTFMNAFPNLLSNLLPIRSRAALFSIATSNTMVDVLLVGGLVCFLKPFKMDGAAVVRDLLFLTLGIELTHYTIIQNGCVTQTECISKSVFLIYFILEQQS